MNLSSSTRFRLAPSPPILISSNAVIASAFRPELVGGPQHRLDDVLVAGAPAQVPRQRPADVLLAGARVLGEQRLGGHHHARGAEPALETVLGPETLLQRVQLAGAGQPFDGLDVVAVGLHR